MDKTLKSLIILVGVMLCVWFVTLAVNVNADDTYKRATISAENTFTDAIKIPAGSHVNVSIKPISSPIMTIVLQRQFLDMEEGSSAWRDVDSWDVTAASDDKEFITSNAEPETVKYRLGCETGSYTSGSLGVRLGSWQGF